MDREALIFGAGKLGRGFVAEVLLSAGFHITFVDGDLRRVENLNEAKGYTIYKARKTYYDIVPIEDFSALHLSSEGEIGDVISKRGAIVALAVHMTQLEETCMTLALAIARKAMETPDEPLDILLCINHIEAKQVLIRNLQSMLGGAALEYLNQMVGFVDTVDIFISPELTENLEERDPFGVLTNGYHEISVEEDAFMGEKPVSPMIRLSRNIQFEAYRKMYTFNMAFAVAAFFGASMHYAYLAESIEDSRIRRAVEAALEEAAVGFVGEYKTTPSEMKKWNEIVFSIIDNPMLTNTLASLAADVPRKVGPQDRLVGPALLCLKHGGNPVTLAKAIAYAYKYPASDDLRSKMFLRFVEEEGIEQALERYSRLAMRNILHRMVRAEYEALS